MTVQYMVMRHMRSPSYLFITYGNASYRTHDSPKWIYASGRLEPWFKRLDDNRLDR